MKILPNLIFGVYGKDYHYVQYLFCRLKVLLRVVASPFSDSDFNIIKFHRLAHSARQCLLYGRQDSVTAGLWDPLHHASAKSLFKNTNMHEDCMAQIVIQVISMVYHIPT